MARTNTVDSTKPVTNSALLSAEIRSNFSVLKDSDERVFDVVAHYGADPTGVTDNQEVLINQAITDAVAYGQGSKVVLGTGGTYKCAGGIDFFSTTANAWGITFDGAGAKLSVTLGAAGDMFTLGDSTNTGAVEHCDIGNFILESADKYAGTDGLKLRGTTTAFNNIHDIKIAATTVVIPIVDGCGVSLLPDGNGMFRNSFRNIVVQGFDVDYEIGYDESASAYATNAPNRTYFYNCLGAYFKKIGWSFGWVNGASCYPIETESVMSGEEANATSVLLKAGTGGDAGKNATSIVGFMYLEDGITNIGVDVEDGVSNCDFSIVAPTGVSSGNKVKLRASNFDDGNIFHEKRTFQVEGVTCTGINPPSSKNLSFNEEGGDTVAKIVTDAFQIDILGEVKHLQSADSSASGTSIAVDGTSYIQVTRSGGATNVNTLSGGETGQRVLLEFMDTNTTLTQTGNLDIAGNFTPSNAGATFELIYNGTIWLEISRNTNA